MSGPNGDPDQPPAPGLPEEPSEVLVVGGEGDPPKPKLSEKRERLVSQEAMRAILVIAFSCIFALTLVAGFVGVFSNSWEQTKDLLQLVLPVETSLLGAAVGYYFGASAS